MACFLAARAWLDDGRVPAPDAPATGAATGARAHPQTPCVGVVLRLTGRVVGLGRACDEAGSALPRAVQQAIGAARQDAAVRALGEGGLRHLTLELEAGGEPQVLVGGTFEAALAPLQPAMQGLMLRHGERSAYLPAGHVLARGMAAPLSRTVLALVTELQIPPRDLPELRGAASTALYGVPAQRMVQRSPGALPVIVGRLAPVLTAEPHDRAAMATTASAIAHRLASQALPGQASTATETVTDPAAPDSERSMRATLQKLGLGGTYEPLADEWREIAASPADQALGAYALARAARCAAFPAKDREVWRAAAVAVLRALERTAPGEADPREAPGCPALALLAAAELEDIAAGPSAERAGVPPLSPSLAAAFAERSQRAARGASAGSSQTNASGGSRFDALRAIALSAAMATGARAEPPLPSAEERSAALQGAWSALDQEGVLAWGPWLLLAERAELRAGGARATAAGERIAAGRALFDRTIAALVAAQRAAEEDTTAPPDTWGAYPVLDAAGARATAQSARPMHAAALVLQVCPPATPEGVEMLTRSVGAGARFLAQLQIGPGMNYTLRSPERAHGGIMAAPYEPAVVPAAQGMALLALVEALEAAEAPRPCTQP